MKHLWMTVGLPRSGKSTFVQRTGLPIVNPDSIRLALTGQRYYGPAEPIVWATAKLMTRALFLAGHNDVILDATNTTQQRRAEWKADLWVRSFLIVSTSPAVCLERAESAKDEVILPVIRKMVEEYEPIGASEIDDDQFSRLFSVGTDTEFYLKQFKGFLEP